MKFNQSYSAWWDIQFNGNYTFSNGWTLGGVVNVAKKAGKLFETLIISSDPVDEIEDQISENEDAILRRRRLVRDLRFIF